jgi:hypothetical protein
MVCISAPLGVRMHFIQDFYLLCTAYLTHHHLHPVEHVGYLSGLWETLKYHAACIRLIECKYGHYFYPGKPPRPQSPAARAGPADLRIDLWNDKSDVMPSRRGPGWGGLRIMGGEHPGSTCSWSIYNPQKYAQKTSRPLLLDGTNKAWSLDSTTMRPLQQKQRHARKALRFWFNTPITWDHVDRYLLKSELLFNMASLGV